MLPGALVKLQVLVQYSFVGLGVHLEIRQIKVLFLGWNRFLLTKIINHKIICFKTYTLVCAMVMGWD